MDKTEIINHLLGHSVCRRYLEVGSGVRDCFDRVQTGIKHDIEPNPPSGMRPTWRMTPDEAFASMGPAHEYDVVLIDGLHQCDQVARDVLNASHRLYKDGYIVLHDCIPRGEEMQVRVCPGAVSWMGDVWKFQTWLVERFPNVVTITDEECGVGIVSGPIFYDIPPLEDLLRFEWKDFSLPRMRGIAWKDWMAS